MVNRRIDLDVTLRHADAETVAKLLGEYASGQERHAKHTRSAPVRGICLRDAAEARRLATLITSNLWEWTQTTTS